MRSPWIAVSMLCLVLCTRVCMGEGRLYPIEQGRKIGFITSRGKVVVRPQFGAVGEWSEGLLRVNVGGVHGLGGKWGFISTQEGGKFVINPKYDGAGDFSEGYAAVRSGGEIGGLWGFIDKAGRLACDYQFCSVGRVSQGLVRVKVGGKLTGRIVGKWGYLSPEKRWKFVLNPVYDEASDFTVDGIASVRIGRKSGWIDKKGEFVWASEDE